MEHKGLEAIYVNGVFKPTTKAVLRNGTKAKIIIIPSRLTTFGKNVG